MIPASTIVATVAMLVATIAHVFMFARESLLFQRPSSQRMLEIQPAHASAIRLWAYHQGIYNLLLGGTGLAGALALLAGGAEAGVALILAAAVSMITAAVALLAVDRRVARIPGFLAQAVPPSVALLALLAS